MLKIALKVLELIEENGFDAYIVGGFVRDYILNITSHDIDICTSATPKDIHQIFKNTCLPNEDYGSVTLIYNNIRFEITTFREESSYLNNRRPGEIKYIKSLSEDLKRRDFTINTLCMDKEGRIIDLLNGKEDIDNKVIRAVGNPDERLKEDSLRILRAVRFATSLNFELEEMTKQAIIDNKDLLNRLSYNRKKEELEKIFLSPNIKYGLNLLKDLELDKILNIEKIHTISKFDDLIGVWARLDVLELYPFTNNEKNLIKSINEVYQLDNLNPLVLYKYQLYVNSVAGNLKNISKKKIAEAYNNLPIKTRKDIDITTEEICNILNKKPGVFLKEVWEDLEEKILNSKLKNEKSEIINYLNINNNVIC